MNHSSKFKVQSSKFGVLVLLALLLPLCAFAADAPPESGGAAGTLKLGWVQWSVVVLIPALIAGLKKLIPTMPGLVILTLCPVLGVVANWIMALAGMENNDPAVAAALGSLGVFLRETVDQAKKATNLRAEKFPAYAFALIPVLSMSLLTSSATAAESASVRARSFYVDSFVTAATESFSADNYGVGIGLGYQLSSVWAIEARALHEGFETEGHAVNDVGLRLVAGSPLKRFPSLRPYAFVGGGYHLQAHRWHVDPGAGLEFALFKSISLFAETGLRADVEDNRFTWTGAAGVRFRF